MKKLIKGYSVPEESICTKCSFKGNTELYFGIRMRRYAQSQCIRCRNGRTTVYKQSRTTGFSTDSMKKVDQTNIVTASTNVSFDELTDNEIRALYRQTYPNAGTLAGVSRLRERLKKKLGW